MKHRYMIFAVSMSFVGLSAMSEEKDYEKTLAENLNLRPFFDAPYIAKWQKIGKDPQERRKLVNVYEDFYQERIKNNIAWTAAGWASCAAVYVYRHSFPIPKKTIISGSLAYLFSLRQTYLLVRNNYRADLAVRGDLYYLNNDIWEQLGYPAVHKRWIYPYCYHFWRKDWSSETKYRINTVSDIERALSGKHPEKI